MGAQRQAVSALDTDSGSWQQGVISGLANGSRRLQRNISMLARKQVDIDIWLIANNGQQGSVGGTSAAAPLWAVHRAGRTSRAPPPANPALAFSIPR